ncbi:MFS transporter [Roseomonas sp. AR75]|jgi:predicted MFS family arabinose efflux permease|uniref:MFS transporter n=1 Tax=Roseomonas sp. AR75 TaxID=2562311 RepID=UPI001F0FDD6B|nr:MFS transporter [Roseomonas sp. AR75]
MPLISDPTTRLIFVLGLGAGASSLAGRALDPLVGVLSGEFAVAAATVALLTTAYALPYALVQPILGPIGDALGKRRVIRVCLVVLTLALVASAFAPTLAALAVLRVLAGAASGGVFPLAIASVGDNVPLERRQVALSRLLVAGLSGSIAGGALSALLEPFIGWRGVMLLCAAACLASLLVLREESPPPAARRFNLAEALNRYRSILGLAAARRLYMAVFIEGALLFGVFPFLAPLFAQRGQGGTLEAGFAIAGYALGGFVFAALAPVLLRRLGQSGTIMLGGVVCGGGLAMLAVAPLAWIGIGACLVLGTGFYMIHSAIQTRVTEVAPQSRGSAVSLHACSFFLGQSVGPVLMGAGWATVGPVAALLASAAGMVLLAVWLSRAGRRGAAGGR